MTTYEELDIENMTQADVRNVILKGDRISIEVESLDGLLVRTAERGLDGLRVRFLNGAMPIYIKNLTDYGMTVTRVERPIPEVELPTVPGYYEAPQFPLSEGLRPYLLSRQGQWYSNGGKVTEERMRELMPLARLVPETEAAPAKLADRIDLKSLTERLRRMHADMSTTWAEDTEALIAAIDNGELDK